MRDDSHISDLVVARLRAARPLDEGVGIRGLGVVRLFGPDGRLKHYDEFRNLVTDVGDGHYGAAGAARNANATVTAPPNVTGMQLGTGSTAAAKSGAGAAIVTYIAGSDKAIDAGFPTHDGTGLVTWQTTWAAGEATNAAITEVAIVTRTFDAVVATAAQTISRAVIASVNKAAADTLEISWTHTLLGA